MESNNNNNNNNTLLYGSIACIGFCFYSLYIIINVFLINSSWISTQSELLRVEYSSSTEGDPSIFVTCSYQYDGKNYKNRFSYFYGDAIKKKGLLASRLREAKDISIKINPRNPNEACVIASYRIPGIYFFSFLLGSIFLFYLYRLTVKDKNFFPITFKDQ